MFCVCSQITQFNIFLSKFQIITFIIWLFTSMYQLSNMAHCFMLYCLFWKLLNILRVFVFFFKNWNHLNIFHHLLQNSPEMCIFHTNFMFRKVNNGSPHPPGPAPKSTAHFSYLILIEILIALGIMYTNVYFLTFTQECWCLIRALVIKILFHKRSVMIWDFSVSKHTNVKLLVLYFKSSNSVQILTNFFSL